MARRTAGPDTALSRIHGFALPSLSPAISTRNSQSSKNALKSLKTNDREPRYPERRGAKNFTLLRHIPAREGRIPCARAAFTGTQTARLTAASAGDNNRRATTLREEIVPMLIAPARWISRAALLPAMAFLISFFSPCVKAQMPGAPPGQMGQGIPNQTQMGVSGGMTDQLQYGTIGHGIEREEYKAYQAFLKAPEPAEKIKRGADFLKKYPKSSLAESVDAGMMNAYISQKDWKDSYRFGDEALALDPDDVDVLTTISWTIPHVNDPNDPGASAQLDKAEKYAKRALKVMATMKKPPHASDAQFADAKAKRTFEAHSALGLVYFRRQKYEDSSKETEQAVQGNLAPDATDLFVLGADFHFLNRHAESADAFSRCAQITSTLQEQCKQNAGAEKIQAASPQAK